MTAETTPREWMFVLLEKGTPLAGWWLKIRSVDELVSYLSATNGKYARAFRNYLDDSFYQPSRVGHGPYIKEAPLTLAAYFHGVNNGQSIIEALQSVATGTATSMLQHLQKHGRLYVNRNGGWNWTGRESGDFCRKKELAWPDFKTKDIMISQFPGGQHFYARIGTVDVKNGDTLRFPTYESARTAAMAYLAKED